MRKLIAALLACGVSSVCFAQFYSAGQPLATQQDFSRFELSVGVAQSLHRLEDHGSVKMMGHQKSFSGRLLFNLFPWLGAGVEGSAFDTHSFPGISHYKTRRYGMVAKSSLAPDTLPNSYVLFGTGVSKYTLDYAFNFQEKKNNTYWMFGAGIEMPVWHQVFLGAELQELYHTHKSVGSFLRWDSNWETELALRAGVRF